MMRRNDEITFRMTVIGLLLAILSNVTGGLAGAICGIGAIIVGCLALVSVLPEWVFNNRGYQVDDWLNPGGSRRRRD